MKAEMSDKDKEIAGFLVAALKAGYEVSIKGPDIGKAGNGIHLHMTDEMSQDQIAVGDIIKSYIDREMAVVKENTK